MIGGIGLDGIKYLIAQYMSAEANIALTEARLAEYKQTKEDLGRQIREQFAVHGIDRLTMQGYTWYPYLERVPSYKKEDEGVIFTYLKEQGHADLLKETLHHKTFR